MIEPVALPLQLIVLSTANVNFILQPGFTFSKIVNEQVSSHKFLSFTETVYLPAVKPVSDCVPALRPTNDFEVVPLV